jgi:mannose-6-phosphate isomerase-like protein (cupin superfamily)
MRSGRDLWASRTEPPTLTGLTFSRSLASFQIRQTPLDTYLSNEEAASSRIFRVYKPFLPHYHATCDEYLYVLCGKGTFWMGSPEQAGEFEPGHPLFFRKGVVHAVPEMTELPVVFLSVDTPRRDPKDVIFVNAEDATPESFISAMPNR